MRTAYKFLVQKPEEKNEHVGDLGRWEDNKVDLREIGHIYGFFYTIINIRCS
jgi:hypothetical protein